MMVLFALSLCGLQEDEAAQEPSLEDILREFEQRQDRYRFELQVRNMGSDFYPEVARRVVDDISSGPMGLADRIMLDVLIGSENSQVFGILEEAVGNDFVPASRRLDLAEAMRGLPGSERGDALAEIAGGDASVGDRLRAVVMLAEDRDPRALETAAKLVPEIPREALNSKGVREYVVMLARAGSREAQKLLFDAANDEDLSMETRVAVARSLKKLRNVSGVDELLKSLAGIHRSGEVESAGPEKESRPATGAGEAGAGGGDVLTDDRKKRVHSGEREDRPVEKPLTLERNLIILSITVILGALFVLVRRRH